MNKLAHRSSSSSSASASAAPARLVDFVRTHQARASGFALVQAAFGPAQNVETFDPKGKAEEIADAVWKRAVEDSEAIAALGQASYLLLAEPREKGEAAARVAFRTPIVRTDDPAYPERPDAQGAIASVLKHLNLREHASHTLLVDGMEGMFTMMRAQLDEVRASAKAREDHYLAVIARYEEMLSAQGKTWETAFTAQGRILDKVADQNTHLVEQHIDKLALIEELNSSKDERLRLAAKQERSDARRDKVVDEIVIKRVFPALALKMGLPALGPAPSNGASSSPPPSKPELPKFSDRALIAIGRFLAAINEAEFAAMHAALRPETAKLLEDVAMVLGQDAEEQKKPNGVNGAAKGATS